MSVIFSAACCPGGCHADCEQETLVDTSLFVCLYSFTCFFCLGEPEVGEKKAADQSAGQ